LLNLYFINNNNTCNFFTVPSFKLKNKFKTENWCKRMNVKLVDVIFITLAANWIEKYI